MSTKLILEENAIEMKKNAQKLFKKKIKLKWKNQKKSRILWGDVAKIL